jgi:hypothetical protein
VPVYLVPRDLSPDLRRLRLHAVALADVQQWYARALAGPTFGADPLIVHRSRHTFAELAADDFQAWWPLLDAEFAELGLAWNDSSDVSLLFLVQGAGGWAGADSENGGIDSVAQAGDGVRGNLGGLALIGDSSVAGILTGACPVDGVDGGTIWWCNWNTYRGTIAHELGHTWGIPHPDAFLAPGPDGERRRWDCAVDGDTVMQCHRNFPYDSLLSYEAAHFRSLRFFREGADRAHGLLVERLPTEVTGAVRIVRPATALDTAAGIAWIEHPAQGSATGYPWSVVLEPGARAVWSVPASGTVLLATVGRERGAAGEGTVEVVLDGGTVAPVDVPPTTSLELVVVLRGSRRLELRGSGDPGFRAVLGNARIYGSGATP